MKKTGLLASLLAGLCISTAPSVQSQELYWATSGMFGPFNIQGLIPTFPTAREITIPVSMWILKHPKGNVVFDTGNNVSISDSVGNCKSYWAAGSCDFLKPSQKRSDVIDMQLKKLGMTTDDIKVVVTSHTHLDHAGNIGMFPKAIHVLQKKELYQGWWPEKFQGRAVNGSFVLGDIAAARDYTYYEIDGELDLFGDGTVKIIPTPGHTLGHQSMKIKLPKTGPVIITQDAVWMQENLDGYVAGLNYSQQAYIDSVTKIKMMRDLEGAQILMSHDAAQFEKMGNRWHK
jgi:N-acyl homoserine lactone hydrolase